MSALPDITAEHASECILLWPLRCVAVLQPNVDLDVLARLDARLEAHLDGLRLAGADGFDAVFGAAAKEPGAAWAATILAAESDLMADLPPPAALAEAVSWMDGTSAARVLAAWRVSARHLALDAAGHLGLPAEIGTTDALSADPAIATAACTARRVRTGSPRTSSTADSSASAAAGNVLAAATHAL